MQLMLRNSMQFISPWWVELDTFQTWTNAVDWNQSARASKMSVQTLEGDLNVRPRSVRGDLHCRKT